MCGGESGSGFLVCGFRSSGLKKSSLACVGEAVEEQLDTQAQAKITKSKGIVFNRVGSFCGGVFSLRQEVNREPHDAGNDNPGRQMVGFHRLFRPRRRSRYPFCRHV